MNFGSPEGVGMLVVVGDAQPAARAAKPSNVSSSANPVKRMGRGMIRTSLQTKGSAHSEQKDATCPYFPLSACSMTCWKSWSGRAPTTARPLTKNVGVPRTPTC